MAQFPRRSNYKENYDYHLQQVACILTESRVNIWIFQLVIYSCFSYDGVVPVTGMMKSNQYTKIMTEWMRSDLNKRFPSKDGVFQLAFWHNKKKMKVAFLEWPGHSLDLNQIYGYLQAKTHKNELQNER